MCETDHNYNLNMMYSRFLKHKDAAAQRLIITIMGHIESDSCLSNAKMLHVAPPKWRPIKVLLYKTKMTVI